MIHRARQNTNISLVKKQFVSVARKSVQNLNTKYFFIHKSSFVLRKVVFCARDKIEANEPQLTQVDIYMFYFHTDSLKVRLQVPQYLVT